MNTLTLQKAYRLYMRTSRLVMSWPKRERYNLGTRLENTCLLLMEHIVTAEQTLSVVKDKSLLEAHIKTEILKLLFRASVEQKLIRETNYFALSSEVIEIGKMITGWRRSLQK